MAEQDMPVASNEPTTGRVVMGALLVAAGAALLIERIGAMPPMWRTSIWPVLLIVYGLVRLLQPRGQGREGLFFVLGGAWWLAAVSGWISIERTWPLLFVALGVSIMFQSVTAGGGGGEFTRVGRRQHGAAWILLAILLGAGASSGMGRRTYADYTSDEGMLRSYSILGGSNSRMHATTLKGGEVVAIMGGSLIDLRDVTISPGDTVTLDVFTVMGGGTIRVPENWIVDVKAVPVMGGFKNQRAPRAPGPDGASEPGGAAAAPAPHLVVRGTIIMGGLTIRS